MIPPADSILIESTAVPSETISKSPSAFEPIVKPESISAITGVVKVLFVSVAVELTETNLASPPLLGNVRVFVALSECGAPISVCA